MLLCQRPPMGWNSWNTFGPLVNEQIVLETADKFVELGLRDAGYEYIVIDDCWPAMERVDGKLVPDPEKFPHGMKYVADYVHSKGLKFGIYSSASTRTCKGYPASFDHEFEDAKTFAEWGVDYLKYDYCYKPQSIDYQILYRRMGLALRSCGRDIVYAACNSLPDVHDWIRPTGAHLYRTTTDILDNIVSIRDIAYSQLDKIGLSATGCYNDIDMLVVGMYNKGNVACGGCTDDEYTMHFALWCLLGVPLMIGCDIRNTTPQMIYLLINKELIRINQDAECRPPMIISGKNPDGSNSAKLILFRLLEDGEYALGVFNFTDGDARPIRVELFDIGLSLGCGKALELVDVMSGEKFENVTETFSPPMNYHACRVFRCRIVDAK